MHPKMQENIEKQVELVDELYWQTNIATTAADDGDAVIL